MRKCIGVSKDKMIFEMATETTRLMLIKCNCIDDILYTKDCSKTGTYFSNSNMVLIIWYNNIVQKVYIMISIKDR